MITVWKSDQTAEKAALGFRVDDLGLRVQWSSFMIQGLELIHLVCTWCASGLSPHASIAAPCDAPASLMSSSNGTVSRGSLGSANLLDGSGLWVSRRSDY